MGESLATKEDVAEYLNIHPRTLDKWALAGKGPAYFKVGENRRYDWADVREWLAGRKVTGGVR